MIPQALRIIIPPLTSQYLNLTKNSSLAVAIGYPDLVRDRRHDPEPDRSGDRGRRILMVVYLGLSLLTSAVHELVQRQHGAGGALSMAQHDTVLGPRPRWRWRKPPPPRQAGMVAWVRKNLFATPVDTRSDHPRLLLVVAWSLPQIRQLGVLQRACGPAPTAAA